MKTGCVFVGDVRKCIIYDAEETSFGTTGCCYIKNENNTELYKNQALLIKMGKYYIDIDNVDNYFDCLILLLIKKNLIVEKYSKENQLFINKKTLKPYFSNKNQKIKFKQLKLNQKK